MRTPPAAQETRHASPVLVAGLPRSGTTWVGDILRHGERVEYVFEPDNEKTSPMGWEAKRGLHRFPYLRAGDAAPRYETLWRAVLHGRIDRWYLHRALAFLWRSRVHDVERALGASTGIGYAASGERLPTPPEGSPQLGLEGVWAMLARASYDAAAASPHGVRRVVKSVHCPLALDWLTARFAVRCLIVLRNPHALFASYRRMKMPDRARNLLGQAALRDDLARYVPAPRAPAGEDDEIAFQIALSYAIIAAQSRAHAEWMLVSHDRFCLDPEKSFSTLFDELGMSWGPAPAARLLALDREGSGYDPKRPTSRQPAKWRSELSSEQAGTVDRWIEELGLREFLLECVTI